MSTIISLHSLSVFHKAKDIDHKTFTMQLRMDFLRIPLKIGELFKFIILRSLLEPIDMLIHVQLII